MEGWKIAYQKVGKKIRNLFRIYDFTLYEVFKCSSITVPENIEIKLASFDDLPEIILLRKTIEKRIIENYKVGALCVIAIYNEKIVGYGWLKKRESLDYFVKIKSNIGYLSQFYVAPEFRGMNIYPIMICFLLHIAQTQNFNRCLISVEKNNNSSLKGLKKLKIKKIQNFRVIRAFKISFNKLEI